MPQPDPLGKGPPEPPKRRALLRLTPNPGPDAAAALHQLATMVRFALIVTIAVLAIWLVGDVMAIIFASALLAIILHGLARPLQRRFGLPHSLAVGTVMLIIIGLLTLLIWSNGPAIAEQYLTLKHALTAQAGGLRAKLGNNVLGRMLLEHFPHGLTGERSMLGSMGVGLAGSVTGLLSSALGVLGVIVVIVVAGFYFALSPSLYVDGFLRMVPISHRDRVRRALIVAGTTLWAWTAGQALDMLVVGVLSAVGLAILGVPLALALGVVAGLCNFIPYIGAILGAVPALLLALSVGTRTTWAVLILYSVIQFLEGNVLAPLIQKRAVRMPPGVAILAQTVFSSILGVPGLILASPLTAALLKVMDTNLPPYHPAPEETLENPAPAMTDKA
ncbi:AI-2E family transporter [Formicincola oecophyllae]|uniref:AI-2E family transporter n=2 Tax=Formicincola oecophyllae TaxID=2558361 RepID=A0A4Y6UEK3_9PROT|nr:AI-2E family transporter [Formicincola oecophyllae]